ncbi:ComF family protein [Fervidobacterium thailandense]|uniref:Uncharacterized protein n=1 Tax=Fervidobacterium thailandense TaxID=1008305 RepID=A0A1E3G4A0_9BACT|nr:ComF family protein [Fervidobacterium thailandense]ODN31064.1 hypothetical protein A4H02_01980 [Fervidobacterium thailandense]
MEVFRRIRTPFFDGGIVRRCLSFIKPMGRAVGVTKTFLNTLLTLFVTCECLICGRPIEEELNGELRVCENCLEEIFRLRSEVPYKLNDTEVFFYGTYEEKLRELILAYKFRLHPGLSKVLAKLLFETVRGHGIEFDFVTYVPSTKTSKKKRGFDHMRLVAKELSKLVEKQVLELLRTIRETDQLVATNRKEAVRGKYDLKKREISGISRMLDSKVVLLIDDVLTTGSTMNECLKVLRRNFPRTKFVLMVVAVKV